MTQMRSQVNSYHRRQLQTAHSRFHPTHLCPALKLTIKSYYLLKLQQLKLNSRKQMVNQVAFAVLCTTITLVNGDQKSSLNGNSSKILNVMVLAGLSTGYGISMIHFTLYTFQMNACPGRRSWPEWIVCALRMFCRKTWA